MQGLLDGIEQNGGVPRVLIVDSLSDGYGIGGKVERVAADALARLAAVRGLCLILIEEVQQLRPSPWCFAVDTVIELRLERLAGSVREERTLTVTKNRFGPSDAGPHELAFGGGKLMVLPEPEAWDRAWAGGWWTLPVKRAEGKRNWEDVRFYTAVGRKQLSSFSRSVTLIRASDLLSVLKLANNLGTIDPQSGGAIVEISLYGDGVLLRGPLHGDALASAHRLQSMLIERLSAVDTPIAHVVIGDLAAISESSSELNLARVIRRTVRWLVAAEIPVVLYETAPARIKGKAAGLSGRVVLENVDGASFTPRFGEDVVVEVVNVETVGGELLPAPKTQLLVSDLELRAQFVL